MSLMSELQFITNPPAKPSTSYRGPNEAANLLTELKAMRNGARTELVQELFKTMSKEEQTRLVVTLADAVNK